MIVVLISAANATVRKLFDTSSNSWLELQWVLFGVVFLLCSPWTLLSNEHVRIDIVGHVFFLLPLTVIMIVTSVPFFLRSVSINEQSMNAGGLPQWPAKSLILIGFVLLCLQGTSELIKRIAVLRSLIPDPYASGGGLHATVEAEAERILAAARTDTH